MEGKRRIAGIAAVVLFLLMSAAVARLGDDREPRRWSEQRLFGDGAAKVAVVEVEGEIAETEGGLFGDAASSEVVVSQLRQAMEDDSVEAVILDVDSPGGSVVASDEIYRMVRRVRSAGKPVVARMGSLAASGGYYVSAAADHVVANPATTTGSIGVILVLLNLEEAAGKLGVRPIIIKAGRLKDLGSPFRELSEEERRIFQRQLDEAHGRFVQIVADGRDLPASEVRELADGRIFSGSQARERGLVDSLGDFEDAVDRAKELAGVEEARVVLYSRSIGLADLFAGPGLLSFGDARQQAERALHATGPVPAYLYTP